MGNEHGILHGETVKNPLLSTVLSNAQNIHAEGKQLVWTLAPS